MFLTAGNILESYQTRSVVEVRGVRRALPMTGWLWLAGFLALTGTPPFGTFLSELTILKAGLAHGPWIPAAYLLFLGLAFIGMARAVLHMDLGPAPPGRAHPERLWRWLPPLALAGLSLGLGLYLPEGLRAALVEAAGSLSGSAP
jgi:hydrogenase-4 component F